jgi:hypothetical protein
VWPRNGPHFEQIQKSALDLDQPHANRRTDA